tara:strand:+ start:38295 stop:38747 length:453 start_codon:yes stop_codon:yes gene_type:complete
MKQSVVIAITNEVVNMIELQNLAHNIMDHVSEQIGYVKPKPSFVVHKSFESKLQRNKESNQKKEQPNKPLHWFFHNTEFKLIHSEEKKEKKWFSKKESNDKKDNKFKENIFKLHCFFDITEKDINLEKIMNEYIKMTEHKKSIKSFEIKE